MTFFKKRPVYKRNARMFDNCWIPEPFDDLARAFVQFKFELSLTFRFDSTCGTGLRGTTASNKKYGTKVQTEKIQMRKSDWFIFNESVESRGQVTLSRKFHHRENHCSQPTVFKKHANHSKTVDVFGHVLLRRGSRRYPKIKLYLKISRI